jgi:hypothetical protein
MTLIALGVYAVAINLIPLLSSRGISTATATVGFSLLGVGQVLGRLAFATLPATSTPSIRTTALGVTATAAIALLTGLSGPAIALLAASVLAGAARGTYTLVQATAVADRWGTERLGALNGAFVAPITAAIAVAPAAGVLLAAQLGAMPPRALLWLPSGRRVARRFASDRAGQPRSSGSGIARGRAQRGAQVMSFAELP